MLATYVIEKKRAKMRSLKKATVAWLHLALIPDTHRSTTEKNKTREVQLTNQGTV